MPQKRNPKLCGAVIIPAAQVRHLVPMALEAILQAHEVDGTRSVLIDRAVEQACVLAGDALQALQSLLADLEVFPAKMVANLDLTGGLITAEAVMLDLALTVGRQRAHHIVHDIATQVATTPGTRFDDALLAHPAVAASLDPGRVRTLIDTTSYLGLSADIALEAAHRARSAAQRAE
jgi:adenylosuccinate lyase